MTTLGKEVRVRFHPHALERMLERGATESEVVATVREGECFPARHERTGFRRHFTHNSEWRGRWYATKQVEAYGVDEEGWLILTVIVRYF